MFICMAMLRVGFRAHLFCISQISQCLITAQPNIFLCLAEIRIFLCLISFGAFPRLDETPQMHQCLLAPYLFIFLHSCYLFNNAILKGFGLLFLFIHVVQRMGQVFSGTCVWRVSKGRQGEDKMDSPGKHGNNPAERIWIYKNKLIVLLIEMFIKMMKAWREISEWMRRESWITGMLFRKNWRYFGAKWGRSSEECVKLQTWQVWGVTGICVVILFIRKKKRQSDT